MDKANYKNSETGIVLVISYVLMFVTNFAVIYLGNMFFPKNIVLGTMSLTPIWSIALSMGVLTLIDTFAIPIVRVIENIRKRMFSTVDWMVAYFLINFVGVWLVARGAEQLGMGITSWVVALILALILDFVQGVVMMQLEKLKK